MKKLALTITLLLGMTLGAFAEWNSYPSNWFFNLFNPDEEGQAPGLFENNEVNELMWDNAIETPSFDINYGGGLLGRGKNLYQGVGSGFKGTSLFLPTVHGDTGDATTPLGSGIAVLLGLGGAYLVAKRRKED